MTDPKRQKATQKSAQPRGEACLTCGQALETDAGADLPLCDWCRKQGLEDVARLMQEMGW